jgi:hypothetical protein
VLSSVAITNMISLPSIFVTTGYFGVQWPSQLVFKSADGWCETTTQGIGQHCFGDFSDMYFRGSIEPWARRSAPLAHPPLSVFVQDTFGRLGEALGDPRLGLALWLVVIGLCVLLPILWATRAIRAPERWMVILLAGVATTPMLSALDRGNSAPLAIPALLWFARSFAKGRNRSAVLAIALAALIRPHLLVLAVLFLLRRDLLSLLRAVALTILGLLLSFALHPGDRIGNFTDWIVNMMQYGIYRSPLLPFPQSIGSARSTVLVGELLWTRVLGREPQALKRVFRADEAPAATILDFAAQHRSAILIALAVALCAVLVLLWIRGHRISTLGLITAGCAVPVVMPGVSFAYYLSFLLVPLALLLHAPAEHRRFFESAPTWLERTTQLVFIAAMTVTLVPTALPLSMLIPVPTYRGANLFVALVGPTWCLFGTLLLLGLLVPSRSGRAGALRR